MKEFFRKMFNKIGDEFFTIPNIISIFRILLIPVIIYLYCVKHNDLWTLILVVFSTLTDIADGIIARKCNMITDFGKFLDPAADKLTQLAVFACLITRFKLMLVPFLVLLVKEIGSFFLRLAVYKKTEVVEGAHWHGKMSTGIVILVIVLHLAFGGMPESVSNALILFSTMFMVYSGFLYTLEGLDILKYGKRY